MSDEPSVFDLSFQHGDVDAKIVASLERLGEVVRVLLRNEAKERELSPLQIQLLVYLWHHPLDFGRVGELARRFDLAGATVSDAVGTLVEKGLVRKDPDPDDGRARVLTLTDEGREAAKTLSGWASPLREGLSESSREHKRAVLGTLMDLIASLERQNVISVARMCQTCRFFRESVHDDASRPHHCSLLDEALGPDELRVDCPEHEPASS
jgi:DNA-binding MarR family transcriptional regulator